MGLTIKYFIISVMTLVIGFAAAGTLQAASPKEKTEYALSFLENARDHNYIGESLSQLEHALQAAYWATQTTLEEEVIIAALFHDIGHLCAREEVEDMDGWGVKNHEKVGADFLRKLGFSEKICELVLGHVQAKRYFTAIDPYYYDILSDASKETLKWQGGPMTKEEILTFEKDPLFTLKVEMRKWDEMAKIVGLVVPTLEAYREMIERHLERQAQELLEDSLAKKLSFIQNLRCHKESYNGAA